MMAGGGVIPKGKSAPGRDRIMWRLRRYGATSYSLTDDEYVQGLRRAITVHDRWRGPLIVLYASLLIAFLGILVLAQAFIQRLGQMIPGQGIPLGFLVGAMIGAILGFNAVHFTQALVNSLRSWRTERLLL